MKPTTTKATTTMVSKIETEILDATIERYNCFDAEIIRQLVPERGTIGSESGEWFCLGIRQHPGSSWECVGRRRTRAELLRMVQNRGCQESP